MQAFRLQTPRQRTWITMTLSDSVADAINSAENVDSSVEEGEIMSEQQNKRKTQEVDSEDSASKSEF